MGGKKRESRGRERDMWGRVKTVTATHSLPPKDAMTRSRPGSSHEFGTAFGCRCPRVWASSCSFPRLFSRLDQKWCSRVLNCFLYGKVALQTVA